MLESVIKPRKTVFVIMPFTKTERRDEKQLTSFFENSIKGAIEGATELDFSYGVYRSSVSFDINTQIIRDLVRADIVIADLSGVMPNPNVMYELGVRLAVADKAVVLIREKNPDNQRIFDIIGFYTHEYDPFDYPPLETHLVEKLRRYETGEDVAESPIVRIIGGEAAWQRATAGSLSPDQQRELVLRGAARAAGLLGQSFGPRGGKVAIARPNAFQFVTKNSAAIIGAVASSEALEAEGVDLIAQLVRDVLGTVGCGGKMAGIVGGALFQAAEEGLTRGLLRADVIRGMALARDAALMHLAATARQPDDSLMRSAVITGAQDQEIADAVLRASQSAGGVAYITVERTGDRRAEVFQRTDRIYEGGLVARELANDPATGHAVFDDCRVLVTSHKLDAVKDLIEVLEEVKRNNVALVIFAEGLDGEAAATLLLNVKRGFLRVAVVRVSGQPNRRAAILEDIAVLTGARFVSRALGDQLTNVTLGDLGRAKRIRITDGEVLIAEPSPDYARLSERVAEVQLGLSLATSDVERSHFLERYTALTGKGALLTVGGITENEARDSHYRAESAMHALALSKRGGVVEGGGVALFWAAEAAESVAVENEGEQVGRAAFANALRAPLDRLVRSCGLDWQRTVAALKQRKGSGVDVRTGTNVDDMFASGIVDPVESLEQVILVAHSRVKDLLETTVWASAPQAAAD